MTKRSTLLEQIEQAALDDTADITGALRKCVALGGQSGSEELRTWATRELKGYNASDQLPEYRNRRRTNRPRRRHVQRPHHRTADPQIDALNCVSP